MWPYLLLLMFPSLVFTWKISEFTESSIPVQFLNKFSNSYLIIHYENETAIDVVDLFGSVLKDRHGTYLLNYDSGKIFNRIMANSYVNVVLLNKPWVFGNFSSVAYNLRDNDTVLIISSRTGTPKKNRWHRLGVHKSAGLFLFNSLDEKLYACCYYCGEDTGIMQEIKIKDVYKYVNNFSNFRGHEFQIAYAAYPPFFHCTEDDEKCEPQGSESYLLNTLSQYLNFTYRLKRWHRTNMIGTWDSMILAVHNREIDWAIGGISLTIERQLITDFTKPLHREGYTIAYAIREDHFLAIAKFLFIFNWKIYVFCLIVMVLLSLIAGFSLRLHGNWPEKWLSIFRLSVEGLIDQSSAIVFVNRLLSVFCLKWLFAFWWLFSVIITSYYKSQLASILIKPTNTLPNNVDELMDNGYSFHCDKDGAPALKEMISASGVELFIKLLQVLNTDLFFCESIQFAFDQNVGVIDEETTAQFKAYLDCHLTPGQKSSLRLVRDNIFPGGYHAWSMQEAAPFRESFNQAILRLGDSGILSHWYDATTIYKITKSNEINVPTSVAALNLWNLLPAYFFLMLGILMATMVFVVEIACSSKPKPYDYVD